MTGNTTENEIRRLEGVRTKALTDADWDTLSDLLPDDLVHIHANGKIDDKTTYLATISAQLEFLNVARPVLNVRVHGDTAVVTGILDQTVRVKAPGTVVEMQAATTQTWVKSGGRWFQHSFQATRIGA